MLEGKVKWFNQDRGFGFIAPFQNSKEDVFIHINDVRNSGYREIEVGDFVEFHIEEGRRGRERAVDITKFEYVYD